MATPLWVAGATDVVELDEVKVEARLGRLYHYVAIPGFELVSPYSKEKTEAYALELQRQRAMLGHFIPALAEPVYGAPQAIYLDDHAPAEGLTTLVFGRSQVIMEGVLRSSIDAMHGLPPKRVALADHTGIYWGRAVAPDATVFYSSLYGGSFLRQAERDKVEFVAAGYGFILPMAWLYAHRQPRWPEWVQEGLETLGPRFYSEQTLQFYLGVKPTVPPIDLTLDQVFAPTAATDSAAVRNLRRQARCMLVNWALAGDGEGKMIMKEDESRVEAFWHMVERAEREPLTEKIFAQYFGADAWPAVLAMWVKLAARRQQADDPEAQIAAVFARNTAIAKSRGWRPAPPPASAPDAVPITLGVYWPEKQPVFPAPFARQATRAELVRIRCEYEWRMGREFETAQPELARQCLQQAGYRLRRAYNDGERDPQLLAVLALYEAEAGTPAEARTRVDQAAATKVIRPALYLQQARFRRMDERAKFITPEQKFTLKQVRRIAEPLETARTQRPILPEVYREWVDLWLAAAVSPTATDLAKLEKIPAFFPQDVALLHDLAVLYVRAGENATAKTLVEQALRFTPEGSEACAQLIKVQNVAGRATGNSP